MIRKANLQTLIENSCRSPYKQKTGDVSYSEETGFHIYGELRLNMKLTAAEDVEDARKYLKILETYANIADICSKDIGASLLEVQGERIHLLFPCPTADRDNIIKIIRFSVALVNHVYDKIKELAGKDYQGFAMATDHGRSILLNNGNGANSSIISLGPSANAPAKRLGKEQDGSVKTPAGHLAIRSKYMENIGTPARIKEWVNIDLLNISEKTPDYIDREMGQRFTNLLREGLIDSSGTRRIVFVESSRMPEDFNFDFSGIAYKTTAFFMRADLDGFTKEVENAFENGAIDKLIAKFLDIMNYPKRFSEGCGRRIIELPWAGDCANLIPFTKIGEGFHQAQTYLPTLLPAEWHGQATSYKVIDESWTKAMGNVKWAVSFSGGDSDDGMPVILVATIKTSQRDFLVASGWSVGKSLDALEADGVNGDDTVIANEDYGYLDSEYQDLFRELDSRFKISRNLTKNKIRDASIAATGSKAQVQVSNKSILVPSPRPHWSFYGTD
ncbi:MAG: hypothetical protein WAX69_11725 [Victivallales bacterium]